ncbi:MAG: SAM-dependent DNA methyltransferase [Acidimicrobiia bacterium]|nr:SAM-dependent DNA methyltransferase [Acidimicrobiia bacterium]
MAKTTPLSPSLRKQLETAILAGRRAAESASRAAIDGLGVFADRRPEHLNSEQASLRVGLRTKWRQLGDDRELLIAECAYEQWHRLLFARFLAENRLLLHPQFRAAVTLAECEDLAPELGEPDGWSVAARFASEILPGIFRVDDPCVRLRLAPEGRHALEEILAGIPPEVFQAGDSLGWVYQFWQKDKKDEVNASERKIGGADLGPVTQLFTENYMVRFLLENSLGAWWSARHPDSPLVKGFDYLRLDDEGQPTAGSFDGWPDRAAEVTLMDPCCGSGHFLVEAFSMLWRMRAEEEGLSPTDAQDAVLRDNLFGLELDPRCVQIAMMAVALQAWKAGDGWRELPVPNIACSGIPVKAPVDEWKALAEGDERLESALIRLHILFREADTFGSLIEPKRATEISDPTQLQQSFEDVEWDAVAPLLEKAASRESNDPAIAVLGADAASIARAADYLSRRYSLVATNVPYLGRQFMERHLRDYCDRYYSDAAFDIATCFVDRMSRMGAVGSTRAVVLPQNWLFLGSYSKIRCRLLDELTWAMCVRLGPGAFEEISGEVVQASLLIANAGPPDPGHAMALLDARSERPAARKAEALRAGAPLLIDQGTQRSNPDCVVAFELLGTGPLLSEYADSIQGFITGDNERFRRFFWEIGSLTNDLSWDRIQTTVNVTRAYGGRSEYMRWEQGHGHLATSPQARVQGLQARGRRGVALARLGQLPATLFDGDFFSDAVGLVVPRNEADLRAVWAFCSSDSYSAAVRAINTKLSVANATLVKVPFDIDHWRTVAEGAGPLPEPWSDDPTQWLFEGRPELSTASLQVAVARLVGYRWPEQPQSDDLEGFADSDAIVCLPSVAGEPPAADRVHRLLATAYGEAWSPAMVKRLLEASGSKKTSLPGWLRDDFFKQHCALFGNRPFVWHIWDGQRDGFSAFVNYHRLDRKNLEKLTYTYLGTDWVERQKAEVRDEVAGAEARLVAALELQAKLEQILEGVAPFDVYVRWKELHEQPIGWEPDLNDGVRLNIRPFVEAGVLRSKFNIHWRKDRGKNPDGSERHNDVQLTLTDKRTARQKAGKQ